MKSIITLVIFGLCSQAFAAKNVASSSVSFIYQLDSDATVFEFKASVPNDCGSSLYRGHSPNEAVTNRKFSLVLSAFMSGKKNCLS